MKKIIAVNAGPRKGWNTDTLISDAIRGAEASGAEVQRFDLYRLEKYSGCISCFGCKKERFKGHCICKDGLTPVLDAIREADGLIIASPNYLGDLSAMFRAFYERLVFQNLTYNAEVPCCNANPIPVLLIMTSNAPGGMYDDMLSRYKGTLDRFVGKTEVFVSGDTLQLNDYSTTDWPWYFNAEAKKERHEKVFPLERERVYQLGKQLLEGSKSSLTIGFAEDEELRQRLEKILRRRNGKEFSSEEGRKLYDAALDVFAESALKNWPDLDRSNFDAGVSFSSEEEKKTYREKVMKIIGERTIDKPEDLTYWINEETLLSLVQ